MSWTVILACFALTRLTGVCSCTETGSLQLSLPSLHLSLFPPALISGWWYVEDLHGRSGWAPASFLKPVLDKGHQRNGDVVGKCPGWRQLEIELHSLVQPRSQVRRRGRRLGLVQLNYNLSSSKTFVPKINIKILFSPNSESVFERGEWKQCTQTAEKYQNWVLSVPLLPTPRIDPWSVTAAPCTTARWAQRAEGREGDGCLAVWWWMVASQVGGAGGRKEKYHWHMPSVQPCTVHSCNNLTNLPPSPFPFPLPPSLPLLPSQEYKDTATGSNTLFVPEVRQWWKLPQDLSWPAPRIRTDWRHFFHLVRARKTSRGHWWVSHYIITTPLQHHYHTITSSLLYHVTVNMSRYEASVTIIKVLTLAPGL